METTLQQHDDIPGHGGRRAGAGRPAGSRSDPAVLRQYRAARSRNEAAKADLAELRLREMRGAYVDRRAVIAAAATSHDLLAHALRQVATRLSVQGLPQWACAEVQRMIEAELVGVAAAYSAMAGPEPVPLDR